jgi:Excalibur calcium-binding domain
MSSIRPFLLGGLVILSVFWSVALYAGHTGRERAKEMVEYLPLRAEVSLYSAERLNITGPGVTVHEITSPGSRYRYVYRGLRIIIRAKDHYFLLPVGWTRNGPSYMVRDEPSIRLDLQAPRDRRYRSCSEVKAAWRGPYRSGADPEYTWYPDTDGDGIVCD